MTIQCFKYTLLVSFCTEMYWKLKQMTLSNSLRHVARRQAFIGKKKCNKTKEEIFTLSIRYFPKVTTFLCWIRTLIKLAVIQMTKHHDKQQICNIPFCPTATIESNNDSLWEEALFSLPVINIFEICALLFNFLMHSGIRLIIQNCYWSFIW